MYFRSLYFRSNKASPEAPGESQQHELDSPDPGYRREGGWARPWQEPGWAELNLPPLMEGNLTEVSFLLQKLVKSISQLNSRMSSVPI